MKQYQPANPLIWGAVTGVVAALIVFLGQVTNTPGPDNALLATPLKAGFAFFGFGVLVAMFRNWFNERRQGP